MKVIEVLKKACEYLQLYDERDYIIKLQEYYEKLESSTNSDITEKETSDSASSSDTTKQTSINETNSQTSLMSSETNSSDTESQTEGSNATSDNSSNTSDSTSDTTDGGQTDDTESQLTKPTADDEVLFNFNVLLECFNNVMKHIAIKYCPLYYKEFIDVVDGYLDIDKLKYNPYKIRRICDEFDQYKIRVVDGLIPLTNGNYLVDYQYVPESLGEYDDVINFNNRLLLQGYIYGINSEFSLIRGDQTGSKMWDEKYIEIMQDVSQDIKSVVIKRRRWI